MPSSFQSPAINEITDQVHIVRLELIEQVVEGRGVGIAITEMHVADEQRADMTATVRLGVHDGRPRSSVAGGNHDLGFMLAVVTHFKNRSPGGCGLMFLACEKSYGPVVDQPRADTRSIANHHADFVNRA